MVPLPAEKCRLVGLEEGEEDTRDGYGGDGGTDRRRKIRLRSGEHLLYVHCGTATKSYEIKE